MDRLCYRLALSKTDEHQGGSESGATHESGEHPIYTNIVDDDLEGALKSFRTAKGEV
jgi:hypothetical protein